MGNKPTKYGEPATPVMPPKSNDGHDGAKNGSGADGGNKNKDNKRM